MAKLLAPIFIFQLFCFYHIYTNRSETYWYFIIFIFPLIGGLAYLWMFYYSPQSVEAVADLASQVSADDHELKQRTSDVEFAVYEIQYPGNLFRVKSDSFIRVGKVEEMMKPGSKGWRNFYFLYAFSRVGRDR